MSGDATDWTNEAPSESFVTVSRRDTDSDGDEDLVLTYEANTKGLSGQLPLWSRRQVAAAVLRRLWDEHKDDHA